jgi:hypothetical protein
MGGSNVGSVYGRIGGLVDGNDLRCETEGQRIVGRFGGDVIGKTIDFEFDGSHLSGRYGGLIDGKDIDAELRGNSFFGRIGGLIGGADIRLELDRQFIRGRIGGVIEGFSVDVNWSPDGQIVGRLGGGLIGHDFNGEFRDLSPLVAVALAAIVYYQDVLQHHRSSNH